MAELPKPAIKLRRNGKQQSCEPCRKAKLRCDHASPCSRCAKRNRVPQCVYHPAPMTQVAADKSPTSRTSRTSIPCTNPMTWETGGSLGYSRKPPRYEVGYMGPTGHSAIFLENKANLDEVWDETENVNNASLVEPDRKLQRLKFCNAILAWLPDKKTSEAGLRRFFQISTTIVCHEPTVWHFHNLFWSTYGHLLQEPRSPGKLSQLSESLCKNSEAPFKIPASDAEFLQSCTGKQSRWSMVGSLFVTYALLAATTSDGSILGDNCPFPTEEERRNYACSMLECADACLLISDELEASGNILSLILMFRNVVCQSVVVGDTSHALWKRRGALTSAVTAFGLHQSTQTASSSILFREHQRRLFASVFVFDNTLATFLGRPPGLSRHYVTCELPLDVSEEELMAGGDELKNGIASLDADGWNTRGEIYSATIARAFMQLRLLRDEILELSLGARPANLSARVHDVRERCEQMYMRVPKAMRTQTEDYVVTERSAAIQSIRTNFHLDHLHNQFLLERIDHPQKDELRLLEAAKNMLDIVITQWSSRENFPHLKDSTHWSITCFGVPAASALAMELWYSTCDTTRNFVSRGDVIQKLSVFVACLDWVKPSLGNHSLCIKVRSLIKRILDKVLEPSSELRASPRSQITSGSSFDTYDMSFMQVPALDIDLQEWMNTIDWTQAPGIP